MANKKKQGQKIKKEAEEGQKSFFRWCEIPAFSGIKTTLSKARELPNKLTYRGKIKLHGTNASVLVTQDSKVFAQRRNGPIPTSASSKRTDKPYLSSSSPDFGKDEDGLKDAASNFDFGPFVYNHVNYWQSLKSKLKCDQVVFFGEWCGRGIMKGAAICSIPTRHFAVFSIVINRTHAITDPKLIASIMNVKLDEEIEGDHPNGNFGGTSLAEQEVISSISTSSKSSIVPTPEEILVLPWIPQTFHFDFSWLPLHNDDPIKLKGKAQAQLEVDRMNQLVAEIDQSDPFVLRQFGISGVGEGIVFYPVEAEHVALASKESNDEASLSKEPKEENQDSSSSSNQQSPSPSPSPSEASKKPYVPPPPKPFGSQVSFLPGATEPIFLPFFDVMSRLMFKAKGKSHRVTMAKEAASIDPEVATSIQHLISLFVTQQRCDQGLVETCPHLFEMAQHKAQQPSSSSTDPTSHVSPQKPSERSFLTSEMIKFSGWMVKDVRKESTNEIGDLNPKLVDKAVKEASEKWFLAQMEAASIYQAPE